MNKRMCLYQAIHDSQGTQDALGTAAVYPHHIYHGEAQRPSHAAFTPQAQQQGLKVWASASLLRLAPGQLHSAEAHRKEPGFWQAQPPTSLPHLHISDGTQPWLQTRGGEFCVGILWHVNEARPDCECDLGPGLLWELLGKRSSLCWGG